MPRRRGYRTQPRVSTLGIVHQERRALEGRQIERSNKADTSQLALGLLRGNRCELVGTIISRPFRANRLFLKIPRVETLG